MENRRDPRFHTQFDALYSSGREEGAGTLVDLSRSGAHLEHSSLRPQVGSKVHLYIFVRPVAPFELVGEVVRHTDSGFAIENIEASEEILQLVDDVAGLVSSA